MSDSEPALGLAAPPPPPPPVLAVPESAKSELRDGCFDIFKIVLDKGLLALVVVLAVYLFNKSLETYKAEENWQSEIARERISAASELVDAAVQLREKHLLGLTLVSRKPLDPEVKEKAELERRAAAQRLLAECLQARLLFAPEAYSGFIDYHNSVNGTPLVEPTPVKPAEPFDFSFTTPLDAKLQRAVDSLGHYVAENSVKQRRTTQTQQ
jgi:hypothetical protein